MSYRRLTRQEDAPTYEELSERLSGIEDKIEKFAEQVKNSLYMIYGNCDTPLVDLTVEDVICDIDELIKECNQ